MMVVGSDPSSPRSPPSHRQLILVLLTGVFHVVIELVWGTDASGMRPGRAEQFYNLFAIVLWGIYVCWQGVRDHGLWRQWGFRRDNILPAFHRCLAFGLVGAAGLVLYAGMRSQAAIPATFWIVVPLYPAYGIAQQFAVQVLIGRNLQGVLPQRALRVVVTATLFSAAHFPNQPLMILTVIAGVGFTWIYEHHPNLWVIGTTHGLLGALAYYLVLGLDPGAEILAGIRQVMGGMR